MKYIAKRLREEAASLRVIADQLDRDANAVDEKGGDVRPQTSEADPPPEGGGGNNDGG